MKQKPIAAMVIAVVLTLLTACQKEATLPAQTAEGATQKKAAGINFYFGEEWLKASSVPGLSRIDAVGFTIGSKGYIGGGELNDPYWGEEDFQDFYEYDPSANTWVQKANIPVAVWGAATFVIGTQAYVCTGGNKNGRMNMVYRYDQASDTWTRVADFPGGARSGAVGINIGSEGYVGTGYSVQSGYSSDWWRYDPPSNQWYQEANFPGGARVQASGFSVGSFGYLACGIGGNGFFNDLWEYWPLYNAWIKVANLPGSARYAATGFNYGQYGALTCGLSTTYTALNDFWYYNPNNNTWTQDINFGGGPRYGAAGFSISGVPYVGTGSTVNSSGQTYYDDFWYETYVLLH